MLPLPPPEGCCFAPSDFFNGDDASAVALAPSLETRDFPDLSSDAPPDHCRLLVEALSFPFMPSLEKTLGLALLAPSSLPPLSDVTEDGAIITLLLPPPAPFPLPLERSRLEEPEDDIPIIIINLL